MESRGWGVPGSKPRTLALLTGPAWVPHGWMVRLRHHMAFSILVGPPGADLWPGPTLHPMRSSAGRAGGRRRGGARSGQTGGAARAGVSKSQAPREESDRRAPGPEERLEVRAWPGRGEPWRGRCPAGERRKGQRGPGAEGPRGERRDRLGAEHPEMGPERLKWGEPWREGSPRAGG